MDRRKKSHGVSDNSSGSIKMSVKNTSGKGASLGSVNKKRLVINKDRFSKEKLSVQYSPSNIKNLKFTLASSRAQFLKRKTEFGTTSNQSSRKAYSNSPGSIQINVQKGIKQSLGFRRESNIKFNNVKTGVSTTKGMKKICFLNQKSSRENKDGRLSKVTATNKIQNIKLDSTGGIGDGLCMDRPHSKNRNRKPSARDTSAKKNPDQPNQINKGKKQYKVTINKKLKSGKMPVEVVGNQNDSINIEDRDVVTTDFT